MNNQPKHSRASPSLGLVRAGLQKDSLESLGHIHENNIFLRKNMHWIKFDFLSRPTLKVKVGDAPANTLIDALNTSLPISILEECGLRKDSNKPPLIKFINL